MSLTARLIADQTLLPAIAAGELRAVREELIERKNRGPATPDTLASLALVELELGQLQSARQYAQQAYELAPKSALVLNTQGYVCLQVNELPAAGDCFQRVLAVEPGEINASLGMGQIYHRQRQFDDACTVYRAAIAEHPRQANLHNQLGRALNNQGKLLKAQAAFEQALASQPDFAEAHHNLAHVKRRLGDLPAARAHFKQALQLQPNYFAARYNLGTVHLAEENYEEAALTLRTALDLQPRHPGALCNLGTSLLRLGKTSEAIELLEQSTALEPRMPEAWVNLGLAYAEQDELEDSIEALGRAHSLDPGDPGLVSHYVAILARSGDTGTDIATSSSYQSQNRVSHAAGESSSALTGDTAESPHTSEAIAIAAQLLSTPGRPLPPQAADDFLRLGNTMRFVGRTDLALQAYERSVALRPSQAEAHLLLAGARVEAGELPAALEAIEQALAVRPRYQSAWALKATILQRLGRRHDAARILDLDRFIDVSEVEPPQGFNSLELFNEALVDRVMREPTLEYERSGNATRKGRHTGTLDIASPGPLRELAQAIEQRCVAFMESLQWQDEHPLLGRRPTRWQLQMWSVVMDSQGHQVAHTHDDGYLSGVYYPRLPDVIGDDDHAGWIEFGRPAEQLIGNTEMMLRQLRPTPGRLVIFPSYFVHRTIPFESEQKRVSIAFDLRPLEWQRHVRNGEPATEAEKIAFLERFSADEVAHSEHNLISHLDGVRQVLVEWDESESLCDAGLFHSVYGTESFPTSVLPHGLRDRVRALIGDDAERLAWLFGVMRKNQFYAQLGEQRDEYRLQSRIDDQWVTLTPQEFTNLVRLMVANWFEQIPRVSQQQRDQVRDLMHRMRPYLNDRAQSHFDRLYPIPP
ncbi:MAG: tetratricopeptide repeat protein [Gammaproteobacteria bacterium]|nr:tetratricopeptide repeat protein [Gammaproteobacteria bacterium]